MAKTSYLSISILNVNRQNARLKRQSGLINTRLIYILRARLTPDLKITQTENERWKKVFYANGNKKRTKAAILISNKID